MSQKPKLVRLRDVPELSPNEFLLENSIASLGIWMPIHLDLASGRIHVEPGFRVIGWCRKMPQHLMRGREGQIAVMLFHKLEGEVWLHYPLRNDDDDYDSAIFEHRSKSRCAWNDL